MQRPAVLVANHGPFTWGTTPEKAVFHAVMVEFLAKMQVHTYHMNSQAKRPQQHLIDKHYLRKHGSQAYYGQISSKK
jgi:L-ribulose-5-phosphate 4-epimerase